MWAGEPSEGRRAAGEARELGDVIVQNEFMTQLVDRAWGGAGLRALRPAIFDYPVFWIF